MATGKKSVKATTKRGKVTRIPSGAKAKTADKTMKKNFNMSKYYYETQGNLSSKEAELERKLNKNRAKIGEYQIAIHSYNQKLEKYVDLYNKAVKNKNVDFEKMAGYLSKIRDLRSKIRNTSYKVDELRNENGFLFDKIAELDNAYYDTEPVRWYHAIQGRKASDRKSRAKRERSGYFNDHYNDMSIRRK